MNDPRSIELDLLADWLSLISSKIASNYDRARSGDFMLCDELSRCLVIADTLTLKLRTCSKMAEAKQRFDEQEAELLSQLEKSHKLIESRGHLRLVDKDASDEIGYVGDAS